jgi:hypothetical protein
VREAQQVHATVGTPQKASCAVYGPFSSVASSSISDRSASVTCSWTEAICSSVSAIDERRSERVASRAAIRRLKQLKRYSFARHVLTLGPSALDEDRLLVH